MLPIPVKHPLDSLLEPFTVWLLAGHDQFQAALDGGSVGAVGVHQGNTSLGGVDDSAGVVV